MLSTDTMVDTSEVSLHVTSQDVKPLELFERSFVLAHDHSLVGEAVGVKYGLGTPSISAKIGLRCHLLLGYGKKLISICRLNVPHYCEACMLVSAFNRNHDFGLALRSSAGRTWLLRTDKGFVHLHKTGQLIEFVPVGHCLANLVSHQPGRLVASDFQHLLHTEHGHAALLPRHKHDHPKPFAK